MGSLLGRDAGFTGYDLFMEILSKQLACLVRVGANVTLLTDLGCEFERNGDIVWLWPTGKRDQEPLKVRLIQSKAKSKSSSGREDIDLLTNVFDTRGLSDKLAGGFYKMRWGVEVFYRSFKQTLDQRKLRSGSPNPARAELHWSLTALLLLGLMGVDALMQEKRPPQAVAKDDQCKQDVPRYQARPK